MGVLLWVVGVLKQVWLWGKGDESEVVRPSQNHILGLRMLETGAQRERPGQQLHEQVVTEAWE